MPYTTTHQSYATFFKYVESNTHFNPIFPSRVGQRFTAVSEFNYKTGNVIELKAPVGLTVAKNQLSDNSDQNQLDRLTRYLNRELFITTVSVLTVNLMTGRTLVICKFYFLGFRTPRVKI